MSSTSATRTLYDDWRERRDRLRGNIDQTPHAALHLRVLNYLIDRYREEAATLEQAAPLLDTVLVNHRAIIVNHHCAVGQVAGVKNRSEATSRMARIVKRMREGAVEDDDAGDELYGVSETYVEQPAMSYFVMSRWALLNRKRGILPRETAKQVLSEYPYLPITFIARLAALLLEVGRDVFETDIELLESCHNERAATALLDAWRLRIEVAENDPIAERENSPIVRRLEQGLIRHQERAAKRLRRLLADHNSKVRIGACRLLRIVGSLRDVALLSDLLDLSAGADEHPRERMEIAETMQWIGNAANS